MRRHCIVILITALGGVACSGPPATTRTESTPTPTPPPTAAQILDSLEHERTAERHDAALRHAQTLTSAHPGTPEAEAAAKLLPELEAAIEAARETQRIRAAEAAAAAEKSRLAAKWFYSVSSDPMTSKETRTARITSENTVNFDFPYQGPQHGTLTLRIHPTYGRDAILRIEKGQILCRSYEDCTIRVRFDDADPERWQAAAAADNSTDVIFMRNESRFLQKLRSAHVVRIQIPVYQEGEPMFEFHVGGFDYERYAKR